MSLKSSLQPRSQSALRAKPNKLFDRTRFAMTERIVMARNEAICAGGAGLPFVAMSDGAVGVACFDFAEVSQ
ncbi:MAG TPA: hypothetical protein DCZ08_05470 [Anaerolineaceae bacterium]|nr:hypothetical protein [Anaerolineaceae bacterium]